MMRIITLTSLVAGSCAIAAALVHAGTRDQIILAGRTGSDSATLLIDGRRTSCVDDDVARTSTDRVSVDNLLAPQGCNADLSVFAIDNATQFIADVHWLDAEDETITVRMRSLINVPLAVWIVTNVSGTATDVNHDIDRAAELYNDMQCGFDISAGAIQTASSSVRSQFDPANCASVPALKQRVGFDPKRINTYYLTDVGARGRFCSADSVILIGELEADRESLAHELGHAFSLGHPNERPTIPGMTSKNLMWSGGSNRDAITTAQCFRTNVNKTSAVNARGFRMPTFVNTPLCGDRDKNRRCPPLAFDVVPK